MLNAGKGTLSKHMAGARSNIVRAIQTLMLLAVLDANAACPGYNEVLNYIDSYWRRTSLQPFPNVTKLSDAYCAQALVAAEIGWHMGTPAGYRVTLTSAELQQAHGIDHPVRGFLFKRMFLNSGDSIPADFAKAPVISVDLIAVVKGSTFQRAATARELIQHIDHFIPIIHLSDSVGGDTHSVSAMDLIATNLGARFAVLGDPIPVDGNSGFVEKLSAMRVVTSNAQGKELNSVQGSAILGNPLNALHWLGRDLEYNAQRVQPGDLLSVGQFGPSVAVRAGDEIKVQYFGLPGNPIVSVRFVAPIGRIINVADQIDCFTTKKVCYTTQP
jgi:2-keto-4-pentenoate hydratase